MAGGVVIKRVIIIEHEVITTLVVSIQVFVSVINSGIKDCNCDPGTSIPAGVCNVGRDPGNTPGIAIFIVPRRLRQRTTNAVFFNVVDLGVIP